MNDADNSFGLDDFVLTQYSQTNEDKTPKRQRVEDLSTIQSSINEVSPVRIITSSSNTINNSSSSSIASTSTFIQDTSSTLEHWITARTRTILKLKQALIQKRKNTIIYENHLINATFPTDLHITKFNGYLQYPKTIPEEEKNALIEEEKAAMIEMGTKITNIRLRALRNDCMRVERELLTPLLSHQETIKDLIAAFPEVKENPTLQKETLDAIENDLRDMNSGFRARTPRTILSKRRAKTPLQQPNTPQQNAASLQRPLTPNPNQQTTASPIEPNNPPTIDDINNVMARLRVLENDRKRPNSPNPSSIMRSPHNNNLNMQGRGNGNHGNQNSRPYTSQSPYQFDYSKRPRMLNSPQIASPSSFPYQNHYTSSNIDTNSINTNNHQQQYNNPNSNPNPNNNYSHHQNYHPPQNHYYPQNQNQQYHHPPQQGRGGGRGRGGGGNQGRGNQNQFQQNYRGQFFHPPYSNNN
jgi:hypothetical protein